MAALPDSSHRRGPRYRLVFNGTAPETLRKTVCQPFQPGTDPTSPRSRVPCPASTPFICRTTRQNKKPLMDTGIPHLTMTKSALTVLPSRLPSAV